MVNNRKILTSLIILFLSSFCFSQEVNYHLVEDEKGDYEFTQTLTWEDAGDVLKYEFTIESWNEKKKVYEKKDFIETQEHSVELSLKAGLYRYRIVIFNLLGLKEFDTDWQELTIIKAYKPVVKSISPKLLYLEEVQDGNFEIDGQELRDGIEFYIENEKGKRLEVEIKQRDTKNRHAEIYVNPDKLKVGKYSLVAINEGGLKTIYPDIKIVYKKPVDFDISASYVVPLIFFDDTFPTYLGNTAYLLSATFKMNLMPFKMASGYYGIGVNGFYTRMFKDFENYSVNGNVFYGNLNFVYQYPVRKVDKNQKVRRLKMTIEGRAGVGVTYFSDFKYYFPHDIITESLNSLAINMDLGAGVQIYFTKNLFINIDLDYLMTFAKDTIPGVFLPAVGAGWQF